MHTKKAQWTTTKASRLLVRTPTTTSTQFRLVDPVLRTKNPYLHSLTSRKNLWLGNNGVLWKLRYPLHLQVWWAPVLCKMNKALRYLIRLRTKPVIQKLLWLSELEHCSYYSPFSHYLLLSCHLKNSLCSSLWQCFLSWLVLGSWVVPRVTWRNWHLARTSCRPACSLDQCF